MGQEQTFHLYLYSADPLQYAYIMFLRKNALKIPPTYLLQLTNAKSINEIVKALQGCLPKAPLEITASGLLIPRFPYQASQEVCKHTLNHYCNVKSDINIYFSKKKKAVRLSKIISLPIQYFWKLQIIHCNALN